MFKNKIMFKSQIKSNHRVPMKNEVDNRPLVFVPDYSATGLAAKM